MKPGGYCLFETALGTCGIAWRGAGSPGEPPAVAGLQLPEATAGMTQARMERSCGARGPSAPPAHIAEVIERVRKHLGGQPQDFRDVVVDLEGVGALARQVYAAAREIPPGSTRTYGELAHQIGQPGAAQSVGQELGRNPIPLIVPCHRVVAAGGKPGGFSAYGGLATKARLLELEGAALRPGDANLKFNFAAPGPNHTAPQ